MYDYLHNMILCTKRLLKSKYFTLYFDMKYKISRKLFIFWLYVSTLIQRTVNNEMNQLM